jgi:hypothetical protein
MGEVEDFLNATADFEPDNLYVELHEPTQIKRSLVRFHYEKTGNVCWVCGLRMLFPPKERDAAFKRDANSPLTVSLDHYPVKRAHGGKLTSDNTRLAHRFCNSVREEWSHPNLTKHMSDLLLRWEQTGSTAMVGQPVQWTKKTRKEAANAKRRSRAEKRAAKLKAVLRKGWSADNGRYNPVWDDACRRTKPE